MKFDYYYLEELILQRRQSLTDLSAAAGIDPQELEEAITGHAEMTAGTISTLASVLNLSPEEVDRAFFTELLPEIEFAEKFKSLSAASQRQIEAYINRLLAEEARQLMKQGFKKAEFSPHELSEKAWKVYSTTDDPGAVWLRNIWSDPAEYTLWDHTDNYTFIGTIRKVNEYFEQLYDAYPDIYGAEKRICPMCGKGYEGFPAISRKDSKTEICPECGALEAAQAYEEYLKKKGDSTK